MSARILQFTRTYGFVRGIRLYVNRKYKTTTLIKYPFLKFPVIIRGQRTQSDLTMFRQIFFSKEYGINVPFDPQNIIDLGANIGFASIYFANRFPNAAIYAVEPNEANYLTACKNVKYYNNIELVRGAIWNKNEEVRVVDNGHGEAAFMIEAGKGNDTVKGFTIETLVDTLSLDYIDILKIDIEGSEKEIFEHGYKYWLPKTKILVVETHDRYKKGASRSVLNALAEYDFSLELSGENLVFYNNNLVNPY